MNKIEILNIFKRHNAIIEEGHFIYTSGRHGSSYMNKDAVYPYTEEISLLCRELAKKFLNCDVDIVVSPAIGGVILSQLVVHHLTELSGKEVLSVYAEKTEDKKALVFTRNYDELVKGKKLLIIDDIITAGTSIQKMIEAINKVDAKIVGAGVLCNRGGIRDVLGLPIVALFDFKMESWPAEECPLCKEGIPVNKKLGNGKNIISLNN